MVRCYLFIFLLLFNRIYAENWAEQTLKQLSLREKIGQFFMVATCSDLHIQDEITAHQLIKSPYNLSHQHIKSLIQNYNIGGIIYLYKNSMCNQIALTNEFQQLSKLPLLIGQDCEFGLAMRTNNTMEFAKPLTLAATNDTTLIYKVGYEIGRQCTLLGIHVNFAPVADLLTSPDNIAIGMRSFGENCHAVAQHCCSFMEGLQDAGIIACAKHFPGHNCVVDSHFELPTIKTSKNDLITYDLHPFKHLIERGVQAIMLAHIKMPALDNTPAIPASLSPVIVKDFLQKELGFGGLIVTDGMGMRAISRHHQPGVAELKAFLAGAHIILCPLDVPKAVELIENAITAGVISNEELDQRVLKILYAKQQLGLHEQRLINSDTENTIHDLNTNSAYQLKKSIFQKAITLVSNPNDLIPLNPLLLEKTALVQLDGTLPSTMENCFKHHNIPTYHASSDMKSDTMQHILKKLTTKEVIIIALCSINKNKNIQFGIKESVFKLIEELKSSGKKLIISLFGNPYSINVFDTHDTLILGYENNPEAQAAVFDVIVGNYKASGILPVYVGEYFSCGSNAYTSNN